MANNYTLFSEALELRNEEEAKWWEVVLAQCTSEDDWNYTGLLKELDQDLINEIRDHGLGCNIEVCPDHVWIYSEESGNVDIPAYLVHLFLRKFRSKDHWSLSWACTCSKPMLGEFHGGAVFVTAEKVSYMNSTQWLTKKISEYEKEK